MVGPNQARLAQRLDALPPTFTSGEAHKTGLSTRDLATLATSGEIEELSRGVYRAASAPESGHLDLLAVARRAPHAILCGETALALHDLIDDIPSEVHIAVSRGSHRPQITYPPTVVSQYSAENFRLDVESFEAAPGEEVPMYGAARSVVDAMRFRHRVGEPLALSAMARYLRGGRRNVTRLQQVATALDALSTIRPAVEAIIS